MCDYVMEYAIFSDPIRCEFIVQRSDGKTIRISRERWRSMSDDELDAVVDGFLNGGERKGFEFL